MAYQPANDPLARDPVSRQNLAVLGQSAAEAEESLPILEYLQLLWYRKWTIIAITVLSGVLGWVWVNQQTPVYQAQSTVLLGTTYGAPNRDTVYLAYYNYLKIPDEIAVMRSEELLQRLARDLELVTYPEFNPSLRPPKEPGLLDSLNPRQWIPDSWKETARAAMDRKPVTENQDVAIERDQEQRELERAARILAGGLEIAPMGETSVISVAFRSPNPRVAALIANEVPEAYMLSTLESKYEATQRATKWLSEQMAALRQEVQDAEQAVEIYRSEHGLADVGGESLASAQLSRLNSELIIAKAERAEAEARLAQVRQLALQDAAGAQAAIRLLDSEVLTTLRNQELQARQEVSELGAEYGPRHPRMIQAQAELAQIETRIQDEVGKVEVNLQSDVQFARAREAMLQDSVREAEAATGIQNREEIQLRALEREAAASRALFETFLEQFKETTASEGYDDSPSARILSKAQVPGSPSYPNVRRSTMTITIAGFIAAVLLVFALEALNPGITNPEQAEKQLRLHPLGIVPAVNGKKAEELPLSKETSGYLEALNTLLVSLSLTDPDHEPRVVQVTSSIPEEGKTTLALSLARVLTTKGNRVILVDADLRRSALEKRLGIDRDARGLTDFVLDHNDHLDEFLVDDPKSAMKLMPRGSAAFVNATDIFSSQRMRKIVEILRANADYVIFDVPPVMAVPDARLIGRFVDKTLFVLRWNKTPVKVAKAALKTLRGSDIDIAGAVLQQVDLKRYGKLGYGDSGYYYHYGRYGQYYES